MAFRSGDNHGAIEWATRALGQIDRASAGLAGAPASPAPGKEEAAVALSHAYNTLGVALARLGRLQEAVAHIEQLLGSVQPWIYRLLLQPGMGIVANNVPHERSAFTDDPARPRLLYRARYLDHVHDERVDAPQEEVAV